MARFFCLVGKDIQNKADQPIRSAEAEGCHFHEIFGMGTVFVSKLWILKVDHDIIPPEGEIKHLLWTLHF
jgi:hypothetical protein